MGSEAVETKLPGLVILEPAVFGDERGFSTETWNRRRYEEVVMLSGYVQDNLSYSQCGAFRGLLFQNPNAQGKLVSVLLGGPFDVAVDVWVGSPTFGEWAGVTLSAENQLRPCLPESFSRGFVTTDEVTLFSYKRADYYYDREVERSPIRDNPRTGIDWPTDTTKDDAVLSLVEFPAENLPGYTGPTAKPQLAERT